MDPVGNPLPMRWRTPLAALGWCAAGSAVVVIIASQWLPERMPRGALLWFIATIVLVCLLATAALTSVWNHRATKRELEITRGRIAGAEAKAKAATEAMRTAVAEGRNTEKRRAIMTASAANAAGRMQAMMTSMLASLRELEYQYSDNEVLRDLLELDHDAARAGRLADTLAILSGARSGRRWAKPIAMERILRAAMGRVTGYQRVRLRAIARVVVVGYAAEGVIHALSELIDNACQFSPPTTEVHVYAAEIPTGIVVTIEDSGLVMSESALERAQAVVSGKNKELHQLSSLNGTRFGLAVVGLLARKHGLSVNFRPSALGGTAALVVIPRQLVSRPKDQIDVRIEDSAGGWSTTNANFGSKINTPTSASQPALSSQAATATQSSTTVQQRMAATADTGSSTRPVLRHRSHLTSTPSATTTATSTTASAGDKEALPQRRRGHTMAAAHPEGLPPPSTRTDHSHQKGRDLSPSALGAFQKAITGRDGDQPTDSSSSS